MTVFIFLYLFNAVLKFRFFGYFLFIISIAFPMSFQSETVNSRLDPHLKAVARAGQNLLDFKWIPTYHAFELPRQFLTFLPAG